MTARTPMNGIDSIETRNFAPTTCRTGWEEKRGARTVRVALVVHFGLHHIRGNSAPYFSVTATGYENGLDSFGGACHDSIAERFPQLADLIALHLSDIDGVPMHGASNAWYWAAGVVDMGEQYHGGSGQFGKSAAECLRILADHLRITQDEARRMVGRANLKLKAEGKGAAKAAFTAEVDAMRPRWKQEANAAIRRWNLGVYGDMHTTPAELAARIDAREGL